MLQSLAAARAHFQRKVDFLTKQMEIVQPKFQEKAQIKQGSL